MTDGPAGQITDMIGERSALIQVLRLYGYDSARATRETKSIPNILRDKNGVSASDFCATLDRKIGLCCWDMTEEETHLNTDSMWKILSDPTREKSDYIT